MGARTVASSGSARTQFAETESHAWARTQEPTWPLQPGRFLAGSTIHPRVHRSAVVLGRQPGASRSVRGGGRTRFPHRQGFAWPDGKSWPSTRLVHSPCRRSPGSTSASCPSLDRRAGAFAEHRTLLESSRAGRPFGSDRCSRTRTSDLGRDIDPHHPESLGAGDPAPEWRRRPLLTVGINAGPWIDLAVTACAAWRRTAASPAVQAMVTERITYRPIGWNAVERSVVGSELDASGRTLRVITWRRWRTHLVARDVFV